MGHSGTGSSLEQSEQQNFVLFLGGQIRHCFGSSIKSGKCLSRSLAVVGGSLAVALLLEEKEDINSSASEMTKSFKVSFLVPGVSL